MHLCSVTVLIGLISIALLIYSAVAISRFSQDNFYEHEWVTAVNMRNKYILLLVIASLGILFSAGRLGYINYINKVWSKSATMDIETNAAASGKYIPPHKRITSSGRTMGNSGNGGNGGNSRYQGILHTPISKRPITFRKPIFPYKSNNIDCTSENSRYWTESEKQKWLETEGLTNKRCQMVVYQGDSYADCTVLMIRSRECILNEDLNEQLQLIGFPKGHKQISGDSMLECAFRELEEETCLNLKSLTLGQDYIIDKVLSPQTAETTFVKLLSDKAKQLTGLDKCETAKTEISEILWLKLPQVVSAMIHNPWQFNRLSKNAINILKQSFLNKK